MKINILLSGQARSLFGRASDEIECPAASSASQAVVIFSEKHGEVMRNLLLNESGQPQPSTMLFVNDEQVSVFDSSALNDDDTLTIMPPISGG